MVETEYENKFPECLSMKLHGKFSVISRFFQQIKKILLLQKNLTEQLELKSTIRFGEQQVSVFGGTITFGLTGGELKLNLTNCKIPLENIELTPQLSEKIEIENQLENSQGTEDALALTLRGGLSFKGNQATKEVYKFKDEIYQVYTKGTEENPIWVFQIQTDQEIFIGGWQKKKIGILDINAKPCSIEAFFKVQDENIRLTSATGIWSKDIGRAKIAWLERELLLRWLKPKLQPYISQTSLLYE